MTFTIVTDSQSELLPQLFSDIVVPEAVWQEVAESGHNDVAADGLRKAGWAKKSVVTLSPRVAVWNLGPGESAVLSVALAQPDYRALVDDRAARRCAKTLAVRTLGTGGVLVLA
jgi:predicted nucleic acid-binding protein